MIAKEDVVPEIAWMKHGNKVKAELRGKSRILQVEGVTKRTPLSDQSTVENGKAYIRRQNVEYVFLPRIWPEPP